MRFSAIIVLLCAPYLAMASYHHFHFDHFLIPKSLRDRRELKLDRVDNVIRSINAAYRTFEFYQERKGEIERHTLEDFAVSSTSHSDGSIRSNLDELHDLIVPKGGVIGSKGIFELLAGGVQNSNKICDLGQSPHQLLFNLYNLFALAEIKGYAMIQFSYMMLRLYNKGNFTLEEDLARRSFETQAAEKLYSVKAILPTLSREYWQCDPMQHKEGSTYVKMTQLLQGIIENEVDMSSLSSCKDSCSTYTVAQHQQCYKDKFCAKQNRCSGRLFDCTFYDADAWVCMSPGKERRYDWVEYEDGTVLGNKGQCQNKIKVDSWWRYLFFHCSYCMCKCDAPGADSDRYWSLLPAVADVKANKVVTGVRFVKRERVLHMEIQQAEALPEGDVDEESREWVQAKPVDILESTDEQLFTMSYEQRALDTDRLKAPPGHAVTGIKLRNLGGHLNLEIHVTPISFTDGQLVPSRSTWLGNDATPVSPSPRSQVPIYLPDVPTHFHGHSEMDTVHNQFIVFDASNAGKDVMQSTVPYVDAQPVAPRTGTWLSGVGLYHKGHAGFGGFVGATVETFDFSRHLLPDEKEGRSSQRLTRDAMEYDFNEVANNGRKRSTSEE